MQQRWWISGTGAKGAWAALLVSLAGAAFTASAGMSRDALPRHAAPAPRADHRTSPVTTQAAPAPGTTGTIELPALPVPAVVGADDGIAAARPFATAGTPSDRMRALQCLTSAIYYEAASEPDDGQAAVAQVILNRVRHPAFPATVCGVVYQGSDRRGCQFSYACDGSLARIPLAAAWERARRAAARALAGYVYAPVGLATHYHTYAVTPAWNRALVMTDVVGAHFFHRWKGWWGTAAAFGQAYRGHEPLPEPLAVATAPVVAAVAVPAVKASAPPPAIVVADTQPAHVEAGDVQPRYQLAGDDSQILDRWKDSGKPLR